MTRRSCSGYSCIRIAWESARAVGIEQRLCDDVAFRVVAANQAPDHATLARFRRRHQDAVAGVFTQVVALCITEGLVQTGVVAIDGTKIEADVSAASSATRRQIVDEILEEAEAVDAAEDLEYGARRGDELPAQWVDRRPSGQAA